MWKQGIHDNSEDNINNTSCNNTQIPDNVNRCVSFTWHPSCLEATDTQLQTTIMCSDGDSIWRGDHTTRYNTHRTYTSWHHTNDWNIITYSSYSDWRYNISPAQHIIFMTRSNAVQHDTVWYGTQCALSIRIAYAVNTLKGACKRAYGRCNHIETPPSQVLQCTDAWLRSSLCRFVSSFSFAVASPWTRGGSSGLMSSRITSRAVMLDHA